MFVMRRSRYLSSSGVLLLDFQNCCCTESLKPCFCLAMPRNATVQCLQNFRYLSFKSLLIVDRKSQHLWLPPTGPCSALLRCTGHIHLACNISAFAVSWHFSSLKRPRRKWMTEWKMHSISPKLIYISVITFCPNCLDRPINRCPAWFQHWILLAPWPGSTQCCSSLFSVSSQQNLLNPEYSDHLKIVVKLTLI